MRRGRTPILRHRCYWKRASRVAALGYRHDHTGTMQARLCFHLQPDSYDTDSLIGVLEQLAGLLSRAADGDAVGWAVGSLELQDARLP